MRNSFRGALGDLSRSVLGAQDLRGIPARCRDGGGAEVGRFFSDRRGKRPLRGQGKLEPRGRGELPRSLTKQQLFRDASQPASGRRIRLYLLTQIREGGKKGVPDLKTNKKREKLEFLKIKL